MVDPELVNARSKIFRLVPANAADNAQNMATDASRDTKSGLKILEFEHGATVAVAILCRP